MALTSSFQPKPKQQAPDGLPVQPQPRPDGLPVMPGQPPPDGLPVVPQPPPGGGGGGNLYRPTSGGTSYSAPAAGGSSPVTATGQIAPAAPTAGPTQPAPPPKPAPTTQNFYGSTPGFRSEAPTLDRPMGSGEVAPLPGTINDQNPLEQAHQWAMEYGGRRLTPEEVANLTNLYNQRGGGRDGLMAVHENIRSFAQQNKLSPAPVKPTPGQEPNWPDPLPERAGPFPNDLIVNPNQPDPWKPSPVTPTPLSDYYKPTSLAMPSFDLGPNRVDLGGGPPAAYQPGQLPTDNLAAYNPYQMNQWKGVDQSAPQSASNDLLMRVLQNPESMNPQVVAQLKEQQKEQALAMQRQTLDQMGQSAASRGMGDSGWLGANQRRTYDDTVGNILGGQRQVDIAAAQTNMQDRLNALNAGDQMMTGQVGRASTDYGNTLQGQGMQAQQNLQGNQSQNEATRFALERALGQEGLNQAGAQSGLNTWQAGQQQKQAEYGIGNQQQQLALQRALGQGGMELDQANFGLNQALGLGGLGLDQQRFGLDQTLGLGGLDLNRQQFGLDRTLGLGNMGLQQGQLDLQRQLGLGNLGLDQQRFGEQQRQYNSSYNLDLMNFLNNAAMGRYQLGQGYGNQQQSLMQLLSGLIPR